MKRLIRSFVLLFVLLVAASFLYLYSVWNPNYPAELTTKVHHLADQHGGYTPLAKIPVFLQRAVIATEDRQFYQNQGIDVEGILRAAWVDAIHLKPLQGASTITEQLIKDMFLSDKKTISRKLTQVALAIMISRYLPKNEILSLYLNEVYLGQGAYGVGQAAETYFGKSISTLTPAECTILAGLPQAPSAYDPLTNLPLAKIRQREVLTSMVSAGYISESAANSILAAPLYLVSGR